MQMTVVVWLYAAVAAFLTAYTFYHGVVLAPRVPIFTFTDQALLTLFTIAVGILWPLFVPALAVVATRHLGRTIHLRPALWMLQRMEQLRP